MTDSERKPTWFDRNLCWISPILFAIGIISVGSMSGFYIGVTGFDVTIVAAVLTAITAGAGATLWITKFDSLDSPSIAMTGVLLVLFSVATFAGTSFGAAQKQAYEIQQLFDGIELRARYLIRCAEVEAKYDIPGWRERLGQQPLADPSLCN